MKIFRVLYVFVYSLFNNRPDDSDDAAGLSLPKTRRINNRCNSYMYHFPSSVIHLKVPIRRQIRWPKNFSHHSYIYFPLYQIFTTFFVRSTTRTYRIPIISKDLSRPNEWIIDHLLHMCTYLWLKPDMSVHSNTIFFSYLQ